SSDLYFTFCIHLRTKTTIYGNKFVKWKTRKFGNNIIKRWFVTGVCFTGNWINNLIQTQSDRYLCSHFCNWITRSLGCKCRRSAYPWIYLDNIVLEAIWIKGQLYITSSFNFQSTYYF